MNQSGFYGQLIPHLTSLLSLNFEVGILLVANSGINNKRTAQFGLTPVKWTAVKKDYAAIEIRY
ncbi:hypothetical protein, partial [Bacillus pseudomycoides]|uniref:hypothetical protein n=1 Tax=Bacillus pseudomycoides TaxID=64104 RepID=UPI003000B82F